MKRKWRDLSQADKFMLIVRVVASIIVVFFRGTPAPGCVG